MISFFAQPTGPWYVACLWSEVSTLVFPRHSAHAVPVSSDESSDEALMCAYVAGNSAAFRTLFERYAPRMMRVFRGSGLEEHVARDLTQQTFLQLHRARHDFKRDARVRPWVMTIANNLKRDLFRSRGRWKERPIDVDHQHEAATQAQRLQDRALQVRVREALSRLPAPQRQVVEMHWYGELSFDEIARCMGISKSAAKVRAHRAYGKLRELLAAAQAGG